MGQGIFHFTFLKVTHNSHQLLEPINLKTPAFLLDIDSRMHYYTHTNTFVLIPARFKLSLLASQAEFAE